MNLLNPNNYKYRGGTTLNSKANFPIISVFIDEVLNVSREHSDSEEQIVSDISFYISAYKRVSSEIKDKSVDFAHKLVKYFTSNLLLHHHQDDVPVFSIYLGVNEEKVDINTYGGYYTRFIKNLPSLQNMLDDLLLDIRDDLDINHSNVDDIISELQSIPRVDIKNHMPNINHDEDIDEDDLDWTYTRIVRTPYSEAYVLYLNDEACGEIHVHISKDINTTIVTTSEITEKERALLMGYVHETLLETLEAEYEKTSTINFYTEAINDI